MIMRARIEVKKEEKREAEYLKVEIEWESS